MWGCRIGRIEGILRVIGADAAEPERVQHAEASVSSLMQQLTELQKQEAPLSEQVSGMTVPTRCKGLILWKTTPCMKPRCGLRLSPR